MDIFAQNPALAQAHCVAPIIGYFMSGLIYKMSTFAPWYCDTLKKIINAGKTNIRDQTDLRFKKNQPGLERFYLMFDIFKVI